MEKSDNPYRILGLSEQDAADEAAIKKAYFKLARKCHPDKQKSEVDRQAATAEFAKIADAYALLQDPVRRYDWRQANQGAGYTGIASSSSSHCSSSTGKKPEPAVASPSSPSRNGSGPKRANSNQEYTSPMPQSKKASVQPNSVRMSPPVRPSVVTPPSSTVRSPVPLAGRNSGGRSPARNNSGRPPVRNNSGRPPARNNSGRSPIRRMTPTKNNTAAPVRKPHPANSPRGRTPVGFKQPTDSISNDAYSVMKQKASSPAGRTKTRPSSRLDDIHSEHSSSRSTSTTSKSSPATRRRGLKKTNSLRSVDSIGSTTVASGRRRRRQ